MRLHAFDLDHTLLHCNSSYHFSLFLLKKRRLSIISFLLNLFFYLGYKCSLLSMKKFHELAFHYFLKGASWDDLINLAREFSDRFFTKMLRKSAYLRLAEAKKKGDFTVILSSSPSFLVEAIAEKLEISHFQATEYRMDRKQTLHSLGRVMQGDEKAKALKKYAKKHCIDTRNVIAYSDSLADLPFLEAAGHAVVFRANRKLRKVSIHKGWELLDV
ncbi:MAG TPA: HAD-IB family hydrolase [Chlamydiales bacterium]|nr:HAD-IB family hydrolase [Chlamydiales bacterium]